MVCLLPQDKDNDNWNKNCVVDHVGNAGVWWYNVCSRIHLNHQYKNICGINLGGWKTLSFTEMKIKPVNC